LYEINKRIENNRLKTRNGDLACIVLDESIDIGK
jgi:hypothetical protein